MARVLVVDDDPDIRELITWKLSQAGYTTLAAADGEAGLNAAIAGDAEGRIPDLILVDWMMPKMSGIEVCRSVRANSVTSRIPIILLTANAEEAEVERGFASGVDDYISNHSAPGSCWGASRRSWRGQRHARDRRRGDDSPRRRDRPGRRHRDARAGPQAGPPHPAGSRRGRRPSGPLRRHRSGGLRTRRGGEAQPNRAEGPQSDGPVAPPQAPRRRPGDPRPPARPLGGGGRGPPAALQQAVPGPGQGGRVSR